MQAGFVFGLLANGSFFWPCDPALPFVKNALYAQTQMSHHDFLLNLLIYLGAAVIAVPLFKRCGLASVLGYLAAGSVIGPFGLNLVRDVKSTMGFAEFGVVLLLFVIGLELKPNRLWVLRRSIFGLGGAQVLITTLPLALIAFFSGTTATLAIVVAISLAFSSTAFALQILAEKKQLSTKHGRSIFSILLFQDLAAIPLIAALPLLGAGPAKSTAEYYLGAGKVALAIGVIIFGGRYLLRPAFKFIASTKISELFTAATLLLVLGVALLMESIGLSMALGAFLAGILLADSEYRHELEADIEPFKGLLLGLFFMAVGMNVDYSILTEQPLKVVGLVAGLMALKFAVNFAVAKASGLNTDSSRHLAIILPQGGEFAFVVFGAAVAGGLMPADLSALLTLVVTISMALTPFLVLINEKLLEPHLGSRKPFDEIKSNDNPVIIAGFGRFGQIAGRVLRVLGIGFTALEADVNQVEVLRQFGNKVYYGDASKIDLLKAAGADKARLFILAIDDMQASLKTAAIVRQHFPNLQIYARARNRSHAFELIDLGVTNVWRETLASSVELTEQVLMDLGYGSARSRSMMEKFRAHDERMLLEQHKVHRDQQKLIEVSKLSSKLLCELLNNDWASEDERTAAEL